MSVKDSLLKNTDFVNQIRESFLNRYEKNKELYDEMDIQKIKKDDWTVRRFLRSENNNSVKALEKLDKAMKWRKVCPKETDIPKEFFEVGGMFPFNCDRTGTSVIFMRIRVNLKVPKLNNLVKDFIAYTIKKVDEQENENGFALVLDLTDAQISNADLDLCSYLIFILRMYFPDGMSVNFKIYYIYY